MPAPPEIAQGDRKVRPFEVRRERNAHLLRDAGDQIDAAGKVAVLLQGIQQHAQHRHRAAVCPRLRAEDGVHRRQRAVRDDHLLEQAPNHQQKAALQVVPVKGMALPKLRRELIVAPDRSLDELREERDEQRESCRILLRRVLAAVHVDQVAHRLERVERNAQRQQKPQRRCAKPAEHVVRVLEHGENGKVEHQHAEKPDALTTLCLGLELLFLFLRHRRLFGPDALLRPLADAADAQRGQPGGQRGQQDERQAGQRARRVKAIAEREQHHPPEALWHKVIRRRTGKAIRGQTKQCHIFSPRNS